MSDKVKFPDRNELSEINRRRWIGFFSAAGLSATLMPGTLAAVAQDKEEITVGMIEQAENIAGLSFTAEEREEMVKRLNSFKEHYDNIRSLKISNDIPPAIYFNPVPPGKTIEKKEAAFRFREADVRMPDNIEDLAFYPVTSLAKLIKDRKVTSTALTKMYLARLKKYDPVLHCVVSFTEERAMESARRADEEISSGKYRGPLHGIPWGAKDLFAVKGYKTTWGAEPYKDQTIDLDAALVSKLDEAGAVLVAKLTLGALAMGDNWFGGKTRNPWNPEQGSSGSSAGPGSAVAAGLVGFAIGTETLGSIVSPSRRCGVSGLRPTFGRVSRHGAMALCWSMDKIGPMCRTVEDCAVVFNYIYGPDGKDLSVSDIPFSWDYSCDIKKLRVGFFQEYLDSEPENDRQRVFKKSYTDALETLRSLGVNLVEIEEPDFPAGSLRFILSSEAAAAFDELTMSKRDELLKSNGWAAIFRRHRFIPAVEYIQANRARTLLMNKADKLFDKCDVFVGSLLTLTNLTGHPEVVIPNGFRENGTPYSINFTGKLYGETELLSLARAYQEATGHHLKHPVL